MKETIDKLQAALNEAYLSDLEQQAGGFQLCIAVSQAIGAMKAYKDFDFQRNMDEMVWLAGAAGAHCNSLLERLNER